MLLLEMTKQTRLFLMSKSLCKRIFTALVDAIIEKKVIEENLILGK
jgi:hypothetical protein